MPRRYWYHCACGYRDVRYRNVRRCPFCGGGLVREEPVRPDVDYLLDELDRLRGLLLDCWTQFAYEYKGDYHDGGLSTLERLRAELYQAGLIDGAGRAVTR